MFKKDKRFYRDIRKLKIFYTVSVWNKGNTHTVWSSLGSFIVNISKTLISTKGLLEEEDLVWSEIIFRGSRIILLGF